MSRRRQEYLLDRRVSPLRKAVKQGSVNECVVLIDAGWSIEDTDTNSESLLCIASQYGYTDIVDLLISHNADIDSRNINGATPVNLSIESGHIKVVESLINAGCNLDIPGEQGHSPLHTAITHGHENIIRLLLVSGCNVNVRDRNLCTPIMHAVFRRDDHTIRLILSINTEVQLDLRDKHGQTALFHAAVDGYIEGVRELTSGGCNVDIPKTGHDTPLIASIKAGHFGVAELIIEAGCDVNKRGHHGNTAIHTALNKMYESCGPMVNYGLIPNQEGVAFIHALVERGCDINSPDIHGHTPLYLAAKLALFEMTRVLIIKGCSVNATDSHGDTVLHAAVMGKHPAIVELLIQSGSETTAVNSNNENALYRGVTCSVDIKIIELLIQAGTNINLQDFNTGCSALHKAIEQNKTDVSLLLIDAGCDITLMNEAGEDAMYLACLYGNTAIVARLIQHPHLMPFGSRKLNRLLTHAAVSRSHMAVIEILAQADVDLNRVDSNGRSVIQMACEEDDISMVDRLIALGADPAAHTTVVFRRCCITATDSHPHFDQEPLFIALKHRNIAMLRSVLAAYYVPPRNLIKLLATILRGSSEIHEHYPAEMRHEIMELFREHLTAVCSLQRLCVATIRSWYGERLNKVHDLGLPTKMLHLILRKRLLSNI